MLMPKRVKRRRVHRGRMTGKSYALTDFLCRRKKKLGSECKNYWMRISETSTKAMLQNKADKLVDPDLKRKYDLDLTTKGMEVFDHGEQFMTVLPLSQFGKLKGVGFYDKDFKGEINIVLDEFQLEIGEKRTSFSILYNFIGMVENIARTTKSKIRSGYAADPAIKRGKENEKDDVRFGSGSNDVCNGFYAF